MTELVTGGCLCGAVCYECRAEPQFAGHCQRRDCQKHTGTGHSSHLGVPVDALSISGEVRYYDTNSERGDVSTRGFCPVAAGQFSSRPTVLADLSLLTAGSLDDPTLFEPSMVVFAASAQSWDHIDPALQRFPRMPQA